MLVSREVQHTAGQDTIPKGQAKAGLVLDGSPSTCTSLTQRLEPEDPRENQEKLWFIWRRFPELERQFSDLRGSFKELVPSWASPESHTSNLMEPRANFSWI